MMMIDFKYLSLTFDWILTEITIAQWLSRALIISQRSGIVQQSSLAAEKENQKRSKVAFSVGYNIDPSLELMCTHYHGVYLQ